MLVLAKCPTCARTLKADAASAVSTCEHCGVKYAVEEAVNSFTESYFSAVNATSDRVGSDFVIEGGILKSYVGNSTEVVVPDDVVEIGENAFRESHIKSVVIPGSVSKIGREAFYGCSELSEINIPDNGMTIEPQAFESCKGLRYVNLPEGTKLFYHGEFRAIAADFKFDFADERWSFNRGICKPYSVNVFTSDLIFDHTPIDWELRGKCRYCGGDFSLFGKPRKCESCGNPLDYKVEYTNS